MDFRGLSDRSHEAWRLEVQLRYAKSARVSGTRCRRSFECGCQIGAPIVEHLRDTRLQVLILVLERPLLQADRLHQLHGVFEFGGESVWVRLLRAGPLLLNALVIELFVGEGELFFHASNLLDQLALIEGLLGHNLPAQVLNLSVESLLYGGVFLAHDLSPDRVELVEDLADARLRHLAVELVADLQDCAHSLRRNPVVVLLLLRALGSPLCQLVRLGFAAFQGRGAVRSNGKR